MILDNLIDIPASYYGTEIKDVSIKILELEKEKDAREYFSHDGLVSLQFIKNGENIGEIFVLTNEEKLNSGLKGEGKSLIVQEEVIRSLQEEFSRYDSDGNLLAVD